MNQSKKGSYKDYLNRNTKDISDKNFHFRLVKENKNPTMTGSDGRPVRFVGSCPIQAFDIITEKKDGRTVQRTIRYIQGESSIYKDEQSDDRDVPKKKFYIQIVNGKKIVPGTDTLLLDFMMKSNYNVTNKERNPRKKAIYELIDSEEIIKKEMKKEEAMDDAKFFCKNGDWDEVKAYAKVLKVNMNQSSDEIRWDLRSIAIQNPDEFLKAMKKPETKRKYYVLEALEEGYLVKNDQTNSIYWATNQNQPIHTAVLGKDVIDSLVSVLSTDQGAETYDAIVKLVTPSPEINSKIAPPTKEELESIKSTVKVPTAQLVALVESDEDLLIMLDTLVEKGVIEFTHPFWYKYKGENFRSKNFLINGLKSNPIMYESFKADFAK